MEPGWMATMEVICGRGEERKVLRLRHLMVVLGLALGSLSPLPVSLRGDIVWKLILPQQGVPQRNYSRSAAERNSKSPSKAAS